MASRWLARALGAAALLAPAVASAQQTTVVLDLDDAALATYGLDAETVENTVNDAINSELRLDEVQQFVDAMADATAMSAKGMGVDYASNFKQLVVGGGVGSGVADASLSFGRGEALLPRGGYAASVTLMAGLNVGGLSAAKKKSFAHRVRLFANGMYMPLPSARELGGLMYNAGAHLQLRLVNGVGGNKAPVQWGGLDLTSGFDRTYYQLTLRKELPVPVPDVDGVEVSWEADGDYEVSATNDAIPIELSTNLRVFVFTAYAGGALDVNAGTSVANASLAGQVSAEGGEDVLGTATVTMTAAGEAEPLVPRIFVGAQGQVLMIVIYAQLNIGFKQAYGGHLGGRLSF